MPCCREDKLAMMDIYFSFVGVFGVLVFLACLITAIVHSKRARQFQAIDLSSIAIGFVYGLIMPIVYANPENIDFVGREYIITSSDIFYTHTIAIVLAMIGLYFGWYLPSFKIKYKASRVFSEANKRTIIFWLYLMLLLSVFSMYLYTSDYGGFLEYFSYNRLIRSAAMDEFEVSRYSFLLPFGKFAFIAFFGFLGVVISRGRSVMIYIGLLTSFVASVYLLFANAGRLAAIAFFGILFLALLPKKILTSTRFWVLLVIPFSIFCSWLMYEVSDYFGLNPSATLLSYILKESSFVFVSFFAQFKEGNLFNFFYDVIFAPAYLLPSSWTINWLTNASEINTIIIMGAKKGEQGVTGSMPVDLLTFGLMQFHFFGVLIYAIFFGYVLRLLMHIAASFRYDGVSVVFSVYTMINFGVLTVFYSYPKHIIYGYFPIVLILICYIAIRGSKKIISRAGFGF